jgi:hypothetical protein
MEADQRRVATSANGAERLPYDPPQAFSSPLHDGAGVAVGVSVGVEVAVGVAVGVGVCDAVLDSSACDH